MPFVTEELWQRLPNRSSMSTYESIMIAPYPEEVPCWESATSIADMEVVKDAIHGARSLRADYKFHVKADFYFRTESPEVADILNAQQQDFCTLAKANCFEMLGAGAEAPRGCSTKVISDKLSILVNLTGIINVDTEIARLSKEILRITTSIAGYQKKMSSADYNTKVPEDVRQQNTDKLASLEAELEATESAKVQFEQMR